jgi:adenylate cyclase, class 2
MLEIEKKYRLPTERLDEIVAALDELGAVFEAEDFEENTIYNGEPLDRSGGIVRIRRTQRRSVLTYKRRLENQSGTKRQIEYETEIADPEAADLIVRELGLSPGLVYEKKRKIWHRRDVEIVIDHLPFGLFMEIEGSITAIKEVEMLLGIDDLEVEHETYPRLTARLGTRVGSVSEARFKS